MKNPQTDISSKQDLKEWHKCYCSPAALRLRRAPAHCVCYDSFDYYDYDDFDMERYYAYGSAPEGTDEKSLEYYKCIIARKMTDRILENNNYGGVIKDMVFDSVLRDYLYLKLTSPYFGQN